MASNNGNHMTPQLTPVEEWQQLRLHGSIKELTSTGRVVRWRPVNLTRLLKEGKIPDHLSGFVANLLWAGTDDDTRSDVQKAIDWQDYLYMIAKASLIHPVISDNPGEGEIHPDDLLHVELLEIERMARNPVDEVRRFRGEQGSDVGALSQGDTISPSAE